ncbi:hypothetical protein Tco_1270451, partial [Tanacetum coccineum]
MLVVIVTNSEQVYEDVGDLVIYEKVGDREVVDHVVDRVYNEEVGKGKIMRLIELRYKVCLKEEIVILAMFPFILLDIVFLDPLSIRYIKKEKNKAKRDKFEHEIGRVQEIKAEG